MRNPQCPVQYLLVDPVDLRVWCRDRGVLLVQRMRRRDLVGIPVGKGRWLAAVLFHGWVVCTLPATARPLPRPTISSRRRWCSLAMERDGKLRKPLATL